MKKDIYTKPQGNFLTPKEAANCLHLSLSTIKNYLYSQKLRAFKTPGGHYRINKEDLMKMMRSNSTKKTKKEIPLNGMLKVFEEQKQDTITHIKSYFSGIQKAIGNMPLDKVQRMVDLLFDAYIKEKQVFVMGNGGSASTASHFMVDLSKQTINGDEKRFRVISLSDNIPSMTAWANDVAYEDIFIEQLKNLHKPGSVVIAISASGNSDNVLRAVEFARDNGSATIGLTGFDGGRLKEIADEAIVVPSNLIGQVEDIHLILVHIACEVLKEKLKVNTQQSGQKSPVA